MARRTFFGFNPTGKSVYAWGARLIQLVQSSREKYFSFVFSENDVCFSAFRAVVDAPPDGPASWRYPFGEVKALWDECAADLLREVRDAIEQHGRNVHYAGRSVMLYRATTKTLELADLRRRVTA